MPNILVIDLSGETRPQAASCGLSLMVALRELGAVEAICGGGASCGTCAVRIEAPWHQRLPSPTQAERALLEGLEYDPSESRLSCQIVIGDALDGMTVHLMPSA